MEYRFAYNAVKFNRIYVMKHKKTKFILITLPEFIDNEGALINAAFESGIDLLHIRKPGAKKSDIEALINSVDQKYYDRIMLHD